jgi:hypothetical protein
MAALYPRAAVPLAKLSKRDDLLSSPTLAPMAPPEIPDEPDFKALVAAATPLRDVTRSTTNVLTPWGYSIAKGEHKDSGKSSGGASWETIKAGLMSPPPMAAGLLSPPPNAVVEEAEGEEVADEATGEESEVPEQTTTTAMLRRLRHRQMSMALSRSVSYRPRRPCRRRRLFDPAAPLWSWTRRKTNASGSGDESVWWHSAKHTIEMLLSQAAK